MKLIKSMLTAVFLFGAMAFAQTNEPVITQNLIDVYSGGTSEVVAKEQTDLMKQYLNLSEAQYTDAYQLNLKVADKIHVILDKNDWSEERKKEFIEGNLKDRRNAMSRILTEEQFKLFDEEEYQ